MADIKYRIVIENNTEEDPVPVSTAPNGNAEKGGRPANGKKQNKDPGSIANVMVATNVIKPYIQQAAGFYVSRIEMETGSAMMQRKAQAFSQIGSTVSGIVSAGIMGGAGAALGAAGVLTIQSIIQAEFNKLTIQTQKQIEEESLVLQRSRAGMSTNRSRGGGTV